MKLLTISGILIIAASSLCEIKGISYEFIGKVTKQEYTDASIFILYTNETILRNETSCGVEFWREVKQPSETYSNSFVANSNITTLIPNRINPACEKLSGYACMSYPMSVIEVNYFKSLTPEIKEWVDTALFSSAGTNEHPLLPDQITVAECDGASTIVKLIGRSLADPMFGYTAYEDFLNEELKLQGKDALSSLSTSIIEPIRLYPSQIPIPIKSPGNSTYRYRYNSETAFVFQTRNPDDAASLECYKQTNPPNPSIYFGGLFNETNANVSIRKGIVVPYDPQFDPYNTSAASALGLNATLYTDWDETKCDVASGCIYVPHIDRGDGSTETCFNFANSGGFMDGKNSELCDSYVYMRYEACREKQRCRLSRDNNGACSCSSGDDEDRTYSKQDCCSFLFHGVIQDPIGAPKRQKEFEKNFNTYCAIHIPTDSGIDNPEYQQPYKYYLGTHASASTDITPSATLDASGVQDANYYYDTNQKTEQIPYNKDYSPCDCKQYEIIWASIHLSTFDIPDSNANKDSYLALFNDTIDAFGNDKPSGLELRIQGYQWARQGSENGVEPNLPQIGLFLPSDEDIFVTINRDWLGGYAPDKFLERLATEDGITNIEEFVFQNFLNDDLKTSECDFDTSDPTYKEQYSIFPSSCIRWPYGRVHPDTLADFTYMAPRNTTEACPRTNRSHPVDLLYFDDRVLMSYCEYQPGSPPGSLPYCANDPLTLSQRQAFCNTTKAQMQVIGTVINSRSEADACYIYNHSKPLSSISYDPIEPNSTTSAICIIVQDVQGHGSTIDRLSLYLEDKFLVGHVDFVIAPFNVSLLEQLQPDAYLLNLSQPDPLNPTTLLDRPIRKINESKGDSIEEFFIYPTQFKALANIQFYARDYFDRNGIDPQGLIGNLSSIFQTMYDEIQAYFPSCTPHIPELQFYNIPTIGINPAAATARDASRLLHHSVNNKYCIPLNIPYKPSYSRINLGPAVTVSFHSLIASIPLRFAPLVTKITTSIPSDSLKPGQLVGAFFSESISSQDGHSVVHSTTPQCWALDLQQTSIVNTSIILIQHPLCRGIPPYAAAGITVNTPDSPIFRTLITSLDPAGNPKLEQLKKVYKHNYDVLKITKLNITITNLSPNPSLSIVGYEKFPIPLEMNVSIQSTADVLVTMVQYNCSGLSTGCNIVNLNNNNSQKVVILNFYDNKTQTTTNASTLDTTLTIDNITEIFSLLSKRQQRNLYPVIRNWDNIYIILNAVFWTINLILIVAYGLWVYDSIETESIILENAYPPVREEGLVLDPKSRKLYVNGTEHPFNSVFDPHFRRTHPDIINQLKRHML